MSLRIYSLLFILSAVLLLTVAIFQPVPGFMDAEYSYAGGVQLAQGKGFAEPYLWNYLDDPAGLPHPSHAYWMPLASLLAALGMALSGSLSFSAARFGFILLAATVAPLTAALSYRLTANKGRAVLAGLLAVFSGFYLPYTTTTDTFALAMFLGVLFVLLVPASSEKLSPLRFLGLGILAGAFHLARADGITWLPVAILVAATLPGPKKLDRLRHIGLVVIGYLLIMGPWIVRNLDVFGAPFSPGGLQSLWLTEYDELFSYPASRLTFDHWWASGISAIFQARGWALGINLQRILAEQGLIFLAPLMILGLWRLRKDLRVAAGLWVWLLTFGLMTFIFPFAGARGGLFHSCAAVQPLFWAVTPIGLDSFLQWGKRKRNWNPEKSGRVFAGILVVLAALLSGVLFYQRVIGSDPAKPAWTQNYRKYALLENRLRDLGAAPDVTVVVKNAPGYYLVGARPGVATPYGDEQTLVDVAVRYDAGYVLLESDHPKGLDSLYQNPQDSPPGLDYLFSVEGTRLFQVEQ